MIIIGAWKLNLFIRQTAQSSPASRARLPLSTSRAVWLGRWSDHHGRDRTQILFTVGWSGITHLGNWTRSGAPESLLRNADTSATIGRPGDAAGKWDFDMFSSICNLIYTWNLENSEECGHTCAVVHAGPIFDKDAELRSFQPDSDENICLLAK